MLEHGRLPFEKGKVIVNFSNLELMDIMRMFLVEGRLERGYISSHCVGRVIIRSFVIYHSNTRKQ